jgi:succinate dehydrogenase / fumarate reductase cytochrome b subunit
MIEAAAAVGVVDKGRTWSSIGKKFLMAVTGFTFVGFAVGHMIGNLQLFMGQDQLNTYAVALHKLGPVLYLIRALLVTFFAIHIWTGIRLWFQNHRARPSGYAHEDTVQASVSSRTMIWSGVALLAYVVYHLGHFTFLTTNPEYASLTDDLGRFDVYSMVVLGFQNIWISAIYVVAMFAVAFHVNHAIPSLLQTLGLTRDRYRNALTRLGNVVAIIVFLGYVSMPVAVLAGLVTLPGGGN